MTHTPGPWKALEPRFGYQIIRQDPINWNGRGYQMICSVPQSGKGTHYGEMFKANARLIAAAPDLLSALQALANLDERSGWHGAALDQARAAIDKATK